jgi:hypothetical protein
MTVDTTTRASSTLSSAPDMPQTPLSFTSAARDILGSSTRTAARQDLKKDIERRLWNDKQGIYEARSKARKTPGWDQLSQQDQDQKLREAERCMIQQRQDRKIYVSNYFPVFANYIPSIGGGPGNKSETRKNQLVEQQLDLLESERAHARAHAEEDDDEEMPPSLLKKQEGEQAQELSNIPAYNPKRKVRPTGNQGTARQQMGSKAKLEKLPKSRKTRGATRSTSRDSSIVEKDSEDEDESEAESDLGYDSDDDSDSEDAEDAEAKEQSKKRKAIFPMVAVRRGLALLQDAPTKATPEVKHRFSTIVEDGRKAVLRGRVNNKDDEAIDGEWIWVEKKDWTSAKKRACEDESDVEDCIQVVSKKAKVETES